MIRAILYQERLNFLFSVPTLAVLVVIVLAFAYAGFSGDRWRDARLAGVAAFESSGNESLDKLRTDIADIEAGTKEPSPYDANPMSVNLPAALPPGSLGDFAIGHADLHPWSADISSWRNDASAFGRYQFDNPTTLARSAFDIALIVIVLMPVLMIAVSFDIVASERASGVLAMVLASPARLPTVVWTRLLIRNGLVWLVAMLVMIVFAMSGGPDAERGTRTLLWLLVCASYAAFWLSLIAFCVARFRTAATTAGALVGLWLLFVLAIPASVATIAEAAYPTPSRLAFLSDIREAQGDTNRNLAELTAGFLMDHPEMSVGDEGVPSYYRAAFLSNEAARDATRPIVEDYEAARDGRERIVRIAQFLSPSIIAQRTLSRVAGADLERQHRFQAQVHDALARLASAIGPAVVSQNRISLEEFDALSRFKFEDIPTNRVAAGAAGPLVFLLVLSLGFGLAAQRRLSDDRLRD